MDFGKKTLFLMIKQFIKNNIQFQYDYKSLQRFFKKIYLTKLESLKIIVSMIGTFWNLFVKKRKLPTSLMFILNVYNFFLKCVIDFKYLHHIDFQVNKFNLYL